MPDGRHAGGGDRRRRAIVIGAIVLGLLVFGVGYVLGTNGGGTLAASTSQSPSAPATSPSASRSPRDRPNSSPEPTGDVLPDGKYFVQLHDLQEQGGHQAIRYDLAYYYTGDEANQVAASRGDETPVPNDVYIVNDNPKLRTAPLADGFTVRYLPEGSGLTDPVTASQDRFVVWLGETQQTDFPPKDITYWWITIAGGEVTKIEQQYQP